MSFQAYIDNIKTKTGKTPAEFRRLAERKGLLKPNVKTSRIVEWLKQDFDLGHGHAMAVVVTLRSATQPELTSGEAVDRHFKSAKAKWRQPYHELMAKVSNFGPAISTAAGNSYISLLRQGKKFGIVQVTGDRMNLGIKMKGTGARGRLEPSGSWNAMVTHRVRITDPTQIDAEVIEWLRRAYQTRDEGDPHESRRTRPSVRPYERTDHQPI